MTEIYGELENGELFWLTPDWLKEWEEENVATNNASNSD